MLIFRPFVSAPDALYRTEGSGGVYMTLGRPSRRSEFTPALHLFT